MALERGDGRLPGSVHDALDRLVAVCRRSRPSWGGVAEAHEALHHAIVLAARERRGSPRCTGRRAPSCACSSCSCRRAGRFERIADDHVELVRRLETEGAEALRPHIEESTRAARAGRLGGGLFGGHACVPGGSPSAIPSPAAFARYIARSAVSISASASSPCSGRGGHADREVDRRVAGRGHLLLDRGREARGQLRARSSGPARAASTQNSSPPIRAAVSTERIERRSDIADLHQDAVAGLVPVRVVDPLEAVDVHQQQPERVLVALVDVEQVSPARAGARAGSRGR